MNEIDSTAVTALEDVRAELERQGIRFAIADLHTLPRRMMDRSGLSRRIGADMLFDTAEQAVAAFLERESRMTDLSNAGR